MAGLPWNKNNRQHYLEQKSTESSLTQSCSHQFYEQKSLNLIIQQSNVQISYIAKPIKIYQGNKQPKHTSAHVGNEQGGHEGKVLFYKV